MRVVIDCGHGHNTSGKRCLDDTREWDLNSRIGAKLQKMLMAHGDSVLRVDDTTGITDVSLSSRVKKANSFNADIYISIHHNAGIKGGTGGGTVVYYYSSKPERKTQAQELYNTLIKHTGLKGNRCEKVIKNPFYVLKNTKAKAFLIENGFMDSVVDMPMIKSENHADATANAIFEFLIKLK